MLKSDELGGKPLDYNEIDPKHFLHRIGLALIKPYMTNDVNRMHGYTVEDVLDGAELVDGEDAARKEKKYCLADLNYDLRRNAWILVRMTKQFFWRRTRSRNAGRKGLTHSSPEPYRDAVCFCYSDALNAIFFLVFVCVVLDVSVTQPHIAVHTGEKNYKKYYTPWH